MAPRSSLTLACILLTWSIAPDEARAKAATWDQAKVSGIANKLAKETEKLYDAYYDQPLPGIVDVGVDSHDFRDTVRIMHTEARHFAAVLSKGEGRDKTLPVFRRLKELNDDAQEYEEQLFMAKPTTSRFAGVDDLLGELAPYYEG